VVSGVSMIAYGGCVDVGEGLSDFVVMLLQPDVHGVFGLADVCGCAWVVNVTGAWCMVHTEDLWV
jgi:hypothetical protein